MTQVRRWRVASRQIDESREAGGDAYLLVSRGHPAKQLVQSKGWQP